MVRNHKFSFTAIAQFHNGSQDFGDNIARFSDHDGVANQNGFLHDYFLVVQGRSGDLASCDANRLQHRIGRGAAGSTDTDHDVEQLRGDLLGRVLIRNGPAGRSRG